MKRDMWYIGTTEKEKEKRKERRKQEKERDGKGSDIDHHSLSQDVNILNCNLIEEVKNEKAELILPTSIISGWQMP